MPTYNYTAVNTVGKRVRSTIEATSVEMARNSLRSAGFTVYEVRSPSFYEREYDIPLLGSPKSKDMAIFCRQFASILRAGVPVTNALQMLSEQTENKRLAAAVRKIHAEVEKGESLAVAMGHQSKIFSGVLVSMIAAGEESGNLEQVFLQMEIYFEKARKTRSAVSKAMIYPSVLLAVMVVVMIVMMTRIVPMFVETFSSTGTQLPALTQAVVDFSDWIEKWWWVMLIIVIALIVGGVAFNHTPTGRHFYGKIAMKAPLFGKLVVRSASSTLCRMLSLLLASGINLLEGMDLAAANMTNIYFEEAVHTAQTLVSEGWPLNVGLRDTRIFPSLVTNLISVGESSGDLQGSLEKLADFYDQEVSDQTQKLLAFLEPMIILVMAVFVIILVFAIYLPMISMTTQYDQYLS